MVHHTGKDSRKGLRGHSSLHAALDAAIEVNRTGQCRDWSVAKSKDDNDNAAHSFRLRVVKVDQHEDGEPITSCALEPDDTPVELQKQLLRTGTNQFFVFNALRSLLAAAGNTRPRRAPKSLPKNRPALPFDDVIQNIEKRMDVNAKRRRERTKDAIKALCKKKMVVVNGGFVWVA